MGDPRRLKKKYSGPTHPWQKARIKEEVDLMKGYGYRRKTEIWKIRSELGRYRQQARRLIGLRTEQAEKEKKQLIDKLHRLGLVPEGASLDDVLGLTIRDISERRLQTLVYKKKLASSLDQARQLIVHRHIAVGNKVITSPNYLVSVEEEAVINYAPKSPYANPNHPIRVQALEKEKRERVLKEEKPKEVEEEKEIESEDVNSEEAKSEAS